jgi:Ser/Thr protein kinase RdoA (MazF antagonist)
MVSTGSGGALPRRRPAISLLNEWTSGKLRRVKEKLALAPASTFRELSERVLLAAPALAPPIARRLESVRTTPFRLQPCLRDIWHDHVLFEGDIVRGLIDPAACRTENVATDLARLLGSLIADDRSMWGDAVEAYRRVAHLSGAEFDLCRTLDQSGVLLSALSWLERACLQNDPAAAHPAVLDRLSRFADRLEHLASDFW